MVDFNKKARELMKMAGITVNDLSAKSGVPAPTIYKKLKEAYPDTEIIFALCELAEMPLREFFDDGKSGSVNPLAHPLVDGINKLYEKPIPEREPWVRAISAILREAERD